MSDLQLQGRLGVELVSIMKGCCADSIVQWRPRVIGQKHSCAYCDNPMKTVSAGEVADPEWSGMLNETRYQDNGEREFAIKSLWFAGRNFTDEDAVKNWCADHELANADVQNADSMSFCVKNVSEVVEGTERVLWAAPGVLAEVGLAKEGDAMSTDGLESGGMLHPHQGKVEDENKCGDEEADSQMDEMAEENKSYKSPDEQVAAFENALDRLLNS